MSKRSMGFPHVVASSWQLNDCYVSMGIYEIYLEVHKGGRNQKMV